MPIWKQLLAREIDVTQFQKLCRDIDLYFDQVQTGTVRITAIINDIVLAQGYQDLSGQVLRRTIDMVQEVQQNLIGILKLFGDVPQGSDEPKATKQEKSGINSRRTYC